MNTPGFDTYSKKVLAILIRDYAVELRAAYVLDMKLAKTLNRKVRTPREIMQMLERSHFHHYARQWTQ